MKKLLTGFLILCFFLPLSAEAQSSRYSKPRKKSPAPSRPVYNEPTPWTTPNNEVAPVEVKTSILDRRFFAALFYSTTDHLKYKGTVDLFGAPADFNATETSASALGLAAGYIFRKENSFGYSADLSYELPRTSKGIRGTAGGIGVTGTYDKSPSISLMALGFNANYSLGQRTYLFAGINYPFSSGQSGSLSGQPGYQVGAGVSFTDRWALQMSYRLLKFNGAIDSPPLNLRVQEATFSGMILGLHYHF